MTDQETGITPKEFDFVSQNGHLLGGVTAVWGPLALWNPHVMWWVMLGFVIFATVKEFVYDIYVEDEAVSGGWGGGWEDWSHYMAGMALALGWAALRHRL